MVGRTSTLYTLICAVLAELTGQPVEQFTRLIHFVPDRPGHDWHYAINATKMRNEVGWSPAEPFEKGIRKTVEWYLEIWK
jgi:dTDP-glucose 4,6-dehydratase